MIKNKLDIIWYEFNSEREDIFRNCMYFHQQLYFKMARITIDSENNSRNILSMLKSRIDEGLSYSASFNRFLGIEEVWSRLFFARAKRFQGANITIRIRRGTYVAHTKLQNLSGEWRATLRILLFCQENLSKVS